MAWINLENLNTIAGGDSSFVLAILLKMQASLPVTLSALKSSIDAGDLQGVKAAAHKAKSSFAYLDIPSMRQQLQEIESGAQSGTSVDKLPLLIEDVLKSGNEILLEMAEKIQDLKR